MTGKEPNGDSEGTRPAGDGVEGTRPLPTQPTPTSTEVSRTSTGPAPTQGSGKSGAPPTQPPGLPKIPGVVLVDELGRGGMGVVYRGRQDKLDRMVAVKLLGRDYRGGAAERRFLSESRHLAKLEHKNIVICHDSGVTDGGEPYMVMEYVDGPNLQKWISGHGPLMIKDALRACLSLTRALEHGFERGLIHRDIKAENVLLKPDPHPKSGDFPFIVKIVDFGLSRSDKSDSSEVRVTSPGEVIGSPRTMAPEQFLGLRDVDFRVDVYALGCVLYYALTGVHAFPQDSWDALREAKTKGPFPDLKAKRPECSPGLVRLARDMMAVDPKERPHSYGVLLRRIEELLAEVDGDVTLRRQNSDGRPKWITIAAVVGGLVVLSGFAAWGVSLLGKDGGGDGPPSGNTKPSVAFSEKEYRAETGTAFSLTATAVDNETKQADLVYRWKLACDAERDLKLDFAGQGSPTITLTPPEAVFSLTGEYVIQCDVRVTDENDAYETALVPLRVTPVKRLQPLKSGTRLILFQDDKFKNWWAQPEANRPPIEPEAGIVVIAPSTEQLSELTCRLPYGKWKLTGSFRLNRGPNQALVRARIVFMSRKGRAVGMQLESKKETYTSSQLSFPNSKGETVSLDKTAFVHFEATWDGKKLGLEHTEFDADGNPKLDAEDVLVAPVAHSNELDAARDGQMERVVIAVEGGPTLWKDFWLEQVP